MNLNNNSMGWFSFKKNKSVANHPLKNDFTLEYLEVMLKATLTPLQAEILIKQWKIYYEEIIKNDELASYEDLLLNNDLLHFMNTHSIFPFEYLDWKGDSIELYNFILQQLKNVFNQSFIEDPLLNLSINKTIPEVYPIYGEALIKQGLILCNLNLNTDSFQPLIIHDNDYELVKWNVEKMDLTLQKYDQEW